MILDLNILNKYIEDGWLMKQSHPFLPLDIYNYTKSTQFENHWDEITLMCRGLVVHQETGEIIAKPFPKFFNIEEGKHTPTDKFSIYEKMDGSLIIVFFYQGWQVASRGSFTSDWAIRGRELFNKLNYNSYSIDATYLFELIGPSNRIVVKYPEDKLVLLSAYREGGAGFFEAPREVLWIYAQLSGCDLVKVYDFKDYNTIKGLNWENHEGFVIRFDNGSRCKIKFQDYVTLHSIITNVSSYNVWESLMNFGKVPEEMLTDVPDEFYEWIHQLVEKLSKQYLAILTEAYREFEELIFWHHDKNLFYGPAYLTKYPPLTFMFFNLKNNRKNKDVEYIKRNKKAIREFIWKQIKPEYERPFNIKLNEEEI